jgi:gluconate 2-dehydrogenase gamma chain
MNDQENERRRFLKAAIAGGAAAAVGVPPRAPAQVPEAKPAVTPDTAPPGYIYLHPEEAAFVEALVDHMVPADEHSPKGTDLGLHIYIDRALAGSWGKGDRMYQQGPWKQGVPSQGYQLPLTPAGLYRAGIRATNAHCLQAYGKPFDKVSETQREDVLLALSSGRLVFDNGLPARTFFEVVYQTVMEGLFADPIYGGNRGKAAWKMLGFPGVIANHRQNIVVYKNQRFPGEPTGIADLR